MPDREHATDIGHLSSFYPSTGNTLDCSWFNTLSSAPALQWPDTQMEGSSHFSPAAAQRRTAQTASTWSECGARMSGVQNTPGWPTPNSNCQMDNHQDRTSVFGAPLQFDPKVQVVEEGGSPVTGFAVNSHDGSLSDFGDDDEQDDGKKTVLDEKAIDRKKKTRGRVKIRMEFIENKLRRYTTFSKRKTGIMKKAYELSTLTGTQIMLLVASETGHVYTFATPKLQPMITSESGKALIQTCLNSPDPLLHGVQSARSRMSSTGFEETELAYPTEDERKHSELLSAALFQPSGGMNGAVHSPMDQLSPVGQGQMLGMPPPLHGGGMTSQYMPGSPNSQPKVASPAVNSYHQGMYQPANTYQQGHNPARETTSPHLIHASKQHYMPQSPGLSPGMSTMSHPGQAQPGHYGSNPGMQHSMSYNQPMHQQMPNLGSQDISATTPSPHSPLPPQGSFSLAGEHVVQHQHQRVQRMPADFYSSASMPASMQRSHHSSAVMLDGGGHYRDLPSHNQPLVQTALNHRIPLAH